MDKFSWSAEFKSQIRKTGQEEKYFLALEKLSEAANLAEELKLYSLSEALTALLEKK